MAAYGQGSYGGYQRDNSNYRVNPETGELEYVEGEQLEVSPNAAHDHSPVGQMFAADKTNIGTYAALAASGYGAYNSLAAGGGGAATLPAITGSTAPAATTGIGVPLATGAATTSAVVPAAATGTATGAGLTGAGAAGLGLKYGSQVISAVAQKRAAERAAEAGAAGEQNQYAINRGLLADRQLQTDLEQRKFLEDQYASNARRALMGGLLEGATDIDIRSPGVIPRSNVSGGLRPSAFVGKEETGRMMRERGQDYLSRPTLAGMDRTGQDNSGNYYGGHSRPGFVPSEFDAQGTLERASTGIDPTQVGGVAVNQLADKLKAEGHNVELQGDRIKFVDHPEWGFIDALKNKGYAMGRHGPETQAWAFQPNHTRADQRRLHAMGLAPDPDAQKYLPGPAELPPITGASGGERTGTDTALDMLNLGLSGGALAQDVYGQYQAGRSPEAPELLAARKRQLPPITTGSSRYLTPADLAGSYT